MDLGQCHTKNSPRNGWNGRSATIVNLDLKELKWRPL